MVARFAALKNALRRLDALCLSAARPEIRAMNFAQAIVHFLVARLDDEIEIAPEGLPAIIPGGRGIVFEMPFYVQMILPDGGQLRLIGAFVMRPGGVEI